MCHRSHMPAKKSDAEKGPLGAWAYHVRDLLDASPDDAAAAARITYTTLRKIEGGSTRKPARVTVFRLWQYYRAIGQEKGIPVEDPPPEWRGDPMPLSILTPDPMVAAMDRQTEAIKALAGALLSWKTESAGRMLAQADSLGLIVGQLAQIASRAAGIPPRPVLPRTNHPDPSPASRPRRPRA